MLLFSVTIMNFEIDKTGKVSIEPVDRKLINNVAVVTKTINRVSTLHGKHPISLIVNILFVNQQIFFVILTLKMHLQHAFTEFHTCLHIFLQIDIVSKLVESLVRVLVPLLFKFIAFYQRLPFLQLA
jgi:hypothetical protein